MFCLVWIYVNFFYQILAPSELYCVVCNRQEKELIQLKREAKLKGGFYVDPEAKLLFIVRIRGYVIIVMLRWYMNLNPKW